MTKPMYVLRTMVPSEALAMGQAFVLARDEGRPSGDVLSTSTGLSSGLSKGTMPVLGEGVELSDAFAMAARQLTELSERHDVFAAHLEILDDPLLRETIDDFVGQGFDVPAAVERTSEMLAAQFEAIDDEYLRARADDVRDVCRRLLTCLQGSRQGSFGQIPDGCIVVADELFPSDTAMMDMSKPVGFLTARGSQTSHVCIIARQHGLATMTGVGEAHLHIHSGDVLILDGKGGRVIVNPDESTLDEYRKRMSRQLSAPSVAEQVAASGRAVSLLANAGSVADVRHAMAAGFAGIGLFRTEFLFQDTSHAPTEDEQYIQYRQAAEICGERVLTIRTMDFGADKPLPWLPLPTQENPFLGLRAVRIALQHTDLFKTQLRAILRAACIGNVRVMFPMICLIDEIRQCKALLQLCKDELAAEGTPHADNIRVGMMVETPASVMLVREFAREVDFFSIGTNDLTQYMMAADRGNPDVAYLYDARHPAVLRAIGMVAEAAHEAGCEVCLCGELAADANATPTLLRLGLDSLSV